MGGPRHIRPHRVGRVRILDLGRVRIRVELRLRPGLDRRPAVLDQEHRVRRRVLRDDEGLLHLGRVLRGQPDRGRFGGHLGESAVAAGKAFVGLSSPGATGPAILQGAPLKTVATTYQKNPFAILSISSKKPIAAPKDMVGKKIGVQQGANQVLFKALLTANGVSASDVTIVPVQYDPTVLVTGEVDGYMAYITNEPILIRSKGYETTTFLFADYGLPLVAETFVVLQDSIDNDRAKVKALLKAEIQGWTDAVASPAQSANLAVNNFGKGDGLNLTEQTAEATAQNGLIVSSDTKTNGLFTMTDALIAENIEALGKVGVKVTAKQLFDLSLLSEVYEENPSLKA